MNLNKIPFYLILLLFVCGVGCDCYQQVSGIITDFETGKPLYGIPVYNLAKDWNATLTDSNGHFILKNVSGGLLRCPPMTVVIKTPDYILTTVKIPTGQTRNIRLKQYKNLYFKDSSCLRNSMTLDSVQVYSAVQKLAEFPGGEKKLFSYFAENIQVPHDQKVWQASVYVTFVVDTSGAIRNECIYYRQNQSDFTPFELEVLRVIRTMPKWTPAEMDGRKVNSRLTLPIKL